MGAELEPPLVEIVKTAEGRRFGSVRRGYDPEQVDAFLLAIASSIEAIETELQQLRVTAEAPSRGEDVEDTSDASTKRMSRLAEVGLREVERMLAEAKAESATIVAEAKAEADRTMGDAQRVAKRSVGEARAFLDQVEEDAKALVSGADEHRRRMIDEVRTMQERLVNVAQALELVFDPEAS